MISIEAARDGFVILVGGRKVIAHSRRNPCIEMGVAELGLRRVRGSVVARRTSTSWERLEDFSVVENDPRRTVIDFSGRLSMSFCRESDILSLSFSHHDAKANVFRLHVLASPGEFIFGAGERRSRLNLKGRRVPIWVEEGGSVREGLRGLALAEALGNRCEERGVSFPLPVFVSSRNYWCSLDSPTWSAFDFRNRNQSVIESWSVPKAIHIGSRPDPASVASDLVGQFGRQPEPVSWAFDGAWLGRPLHAGDSESLDGELDACLKAGVKISALWCEGFVPGKHEAAKCRPAWDMDPESGPEEKARLGDCVELWREKGIRCLGYADPYVDVHGPLFREAEASAFLVRNPEGGTYLIPFAGGRVALVDLTNPEASAWLSSLMAEERKARRLSGWLAASGGRLPADALLHSGEPANRLHNPWPRLWAEVGRKSLSVQPSPDAYFGMRSGWMGSSSLLNGLWLGDRTADFGRDNGLPSVVPAALSLGLCGLGFVHGEIGGGKALPSGKHKLECLKRWMELAAFSPLFRARLSCLVDRPEGRIDPSCLEHLALMSGIFAELKPYHIAVAGEYGKTGIPALRHPSLHYEDDASLFKRDYQYLYGRDLFIAPPVEPGKELTELYLPRDEWVHLWSSRRFKGGLVTVESPLGCPAVFYRADSSFAALFDSIRRTAR